MGQAKVLALFLLLCAALAGADRYELKVRLDPPAQRLEVEGVMTVRPRDGGALELVWFLNRQVEVLELKGPQVAGWEFNRGATAAQPPFQEAGLLKVRLRAPLAPGAALRFRLRYAGTLIRWPLGNPDRLGAPWTELGRSAFWYPCRWDGNPFTFRLEVRCPRDFALAGYGPFQGPEGRQTLEWSRPVEDLVLLAAPRNRLRITAAGGARVVSLDLAEPTAQRLAKATGELMDLMQERLGRLEGETLTVVQAPRPGGGTYARAGLLVLDGLDEPRLTAQYQEVLQRVAHEAAHAWWHFAPEDTWEDWLNESFAEYSALAALRELQGEAGYQRAIAAKRRACAGLPRLWEFPRNSNQAWSVMGNKGVVLLAELEELMGRDPFSAFCRELAARRVNQTARLMELLEARAGKGIREAFQRRIMSL